MHGPQIRTRLREGPRLSHTFLPLTPHPKRLKLALRRVPCCAGPVAPYRHPVDLLKFLSEMNVLPVSVIFDSHLYSKHSSPCGVPSENPLSYHGTSCA